MSSLPSLEGISVIRGVGVITPLSRGDISDQCRGVGVITPLSRGGSNDHSPGVEGWVSSLPSLEGISAIRGVGFITPLSRGDSNDRSPGVVV